MNFKNIEWYKIGLVAVLKGSTKVTGTDTKWLSADVRAGDMFISANFQVYEVASVPGSEELTLTKPYQGESESGQNYAIIRRVPPVMQAEIANRLVTVLDALAQQTPGGSSDTASGGVVSYSVTIPSAGWAEDEKDSSGYPWSIDISNEGITESMTPFLTILPASLPVAQAAGLCPTVQTVEGALRVFSQSVPDEDIFASLSLWGVASASDDDGGGETATDDDIQDILNGSYKS